MISLNDSKEHWKWVYISYPDRPPFNPATPVGKQSSNYRAEVQEHQSATDHLIEHLQGVQKRNVVFLIDCQNYNLS